VNDRSELAHSTARRLPGDEGLWYFIAADMALFLLLFGSFASEQASARAAFDAARLQLLPSLATLNTVFLLTSSWFAASAVGALRRGQAERANAWLAGTIILGTAFIVTKIVEYHFEISAGVSLAGNSFFTFYFVITGLHLLHVIGGVTFLCYIWHRLREAPAGSWHVRLLESGASFWHVVDVLWLVIFPLLYLLH
jgi:nitric oxide reductase NorE protein